MPPVPRRRKSPRGVFVCISVVVTMPRKSALRRCAFNNGFIAFCNHGYFCFATAKRARFQFFVHNSSPPPVPLFKRAFNRAVILGAAKAQLAPCFPCIETPPAREQQFSRPAQRAISGGVFFECLFGVRFFTFIAAVNALLPFSNSFIAPPRLFFRACNRAFNR